MEAHCYCYEKSSTNTMIILAINIGLYVYVLYIIGMLSLLYPLVVILVSILWLLLLFFYLRRKKDLSFSLPQFSITEWILVGILCIQIVINAIGVLGPEIGFDALWYHLTIPKIYLLKHAITYIPGGLFYYSAMPKLTEMLYLFPLSIGNDAFAKSIHFLFGICTCFVLYRFSRKYISKSYALLGVLMFYSNLVVGFESITAYIDLSRTFFEFLAFVQFIEWSERKDDKKLMLSAVMLGLAVSTKLLALSSLPIFLFLIVYFGWKEKASLRKIVTNSLLFTGGTFFIPLPWFVSSFLATGKLFYPFFTDLYKVGNQYGSVVPMQFVNSIWELFIRAADPISPLYAIFLPLLIPVYKKRHPLFMISTLYIFLATIIWYIIPRVGGGRFILPYLPVFSFSVIYGVYILSKTQKYMPFVRVFVALILFYSLLFIGYRGYANTKFIPFIVKKETKAEFLSKNLHFSHGDFYDIDSYFKQTIKPTDRVLLYGFHNLYYVNFPFIDASYVKKGDTFTYIATQNTDLPKRFVTWNLLYFNPTTKVRLYSPGQIRWVY